MAGKDKNKLRKAFVSKNFKAGSYSLAVCAVALVIAVLVNLIVGTLPSKFTQFDISSAKLYTLSDYSVKTAKAVKDDVTIYHLSTAANRDERLASLLKRYEDLNSHIRVEERDPQLSQIATQYTKDEVSENSLIFDSGKRSKVVDYSSIMGYSEEMQMYAMYGQNVQPDEFSGEREITSALDFVTKDVLPKVYTLQGHGEFELDSTVQSAVATENIELVSLDLAAQKDVPEDCACLMIMAPDSDITDDELKAVQAYFSKGGNLLVSSIVPAALKGSTPNFDALLLDLGIENGDGMIIESDQSAYFSYRPNYLIPALGSHEIVDPLSESNYHVYFPIVRAMSAAANPRSTLSVTPILHTTDTAFARIDATNDSAEKAKDDVDGPFDVAFAVTETLDSTSAHAVVLASPYFLDPNLATYPGNMSLLVNSLKWMCDLEQTISVVETKSLNDSGNLEVNDSVAMLWSAVITVTIPLVLLIVGIIIFVSRKKR